MFAALKKPVLLHHSNTQHIFLSVSQNVYSFLNIVVRAVNFKPITLYDPLGDKADTDNLKCEFSDVF